MEARNLHFKTSVLGDSISGPHSPKTVLDFVPVSFCSAFEMLQPLSAVICFNHFLY